MDQMVPIDCVACGRRYPVEITDVVDLGLNPLLRERLTRGTLNFALCPHCGSGAPTDHAFLVLDPEAGRTILFVPEGGNAAVDAAILRNVLSIYQAGARQQYLENEVYVAQWSELMALLTEEATQ